MLEFQRILWFNVHVDKGSRYEIMSWDSDHWCRRLSGNIIADRRQVLGIRENYITEIHDRANRPENLEVESEEEVVT
jgi:hypothetical protein